MKILEFRYMHLFDKFDNTYPHWSRKYEYPTVLAELQKRKVEFKSAPKIHNSSWGFDIEHHTKFKNDLEREFLPHNVINSDIIYNGVPGTCYHDITVPPNGNFKEAFDIVLNVSALEEIPGDHDQYIKNLYDQVKPGGYLICTFDYPGLRSNLISSLRPGDDPNYRICWSGPPYMDPGKALNVLFFVAQKDGL
jgi:SAM-dependent methyltransferase